MYGLVFIINLHLFLVTDLAVDCLIFFIDRLLVSSSLIGSRGLSKKKKSFVDFECPLHTISIVLTISYCL